MKTVVVASDNPLKVGVALAAFKKVFPDTEFNFIGFKSPSGVSEQPMSYKETLLGASNRLDYATKEAQRIKAEYVISMEGGVAKRGRKKLVEFAYILVKEMKTENRALAKTAEFYVPKPIADIVLEGGEIGPASDKVFGSTNCKQKGGSIAYFTDGITSREDIYIQAALFAINELKHPEWFFVK
jgi:inosine/xanthosine triphosphatase